MGMGLRQIGKPSQYLPIYRVRLTARPPTTATTGLPYRFARRATPTGALPAADCSSILPSPVMTGRHRARARQTPRDRAPSPHPSVPRRAPATPRLPPAAPAPGTPSTEPNVRAPSGVRNNLGPRLENRRIEQATVADHPAVAPAQCLGIIRRQTLLSAEHRKRAATPYERIIDIRKHNNTSAIKARSAGAKSTLAARSRPARPGRHRSP